VPTVAAIELDGSDLALPLSAVLQPASPADFNFDGTVGQADLEIFIACASGPAVAYDPAGLPQPEPGCTLAPDGQGTVAADFDADGDVDSIDFATFQRSLQP